MDLKEEYDMQETEAIVRRLAQLESLRELRLKYGFPKPPKLITMETRDSTEEDYELQRKPKPLAELGAQGFVEICCWALKDCDTLRHLTLDSSMDKVTLTRYIAHLAWTCNVHFLATLCNTLPFLISQISIKLALKKKRERNVFDELSGTASEIWLLIARIQA